MGAMGAMQAMRVIEVIGAMGAMRVTPALVTPIHLNLAENHTLQQITYIFILKCQLFFYNFVPRMS